MRSLTRRVRAPWALLAVPVLVVALLSGGLVAWRAHAGPGATASSTAAGMPDPVVAAVGPDSILTSALDARVQVVLAVVSQSGGAPAQGTSAYAAFLAKVRADALKSLVQDVIIAQQARARGVEATEPEVQRELDADVSAAGGSDQLATQLAQAGETVAIRRDETRARLNEAKLEEAWAHDRALLALSQIQGGRPFADVARDFSDDDATAPAGGDMGSLSNAQLAAGDAAFASAAAALGAGQLSPGPVRTTQGWEVIRVDSASPSARSVHRVLVSAPQPYTVKERPVWFAQAVLEALAESCQAQTLRIMINVSSQPCAAGDASAGASPAVSAQPSSGSASLSPAFSPRPTP